MPSANVAARVVLQHGVLQRSKRKVAAIHGRRPKCAVWQQNDPPAPIVICPRHHPRPATENRGDFSQNLSANRNMRGDISATGTEALTNRHECG